MRVSGFAHMDVDETNRRQEERIKSRRWYDLSSQYLQGRDISQQATLSGLI